jgi:hypothetical protein
MCLKTIEERGSESKNLRERGAREEREKRRREMCEGRKRERERERKPRRAKRMRIGQERCENKFRPQQETEYREASDSFSSQVETEARELSTESFSKLLQDVVSTLRKDPSEMEMTCILS